MVVSIGHACLGSQEIVKSHLQVLVQVVTAHSDKHAAEDFFGPRFLSYLEHYNLFMDNL